MSLCHAKHEEDNLCGFQGLDSRDLVRASGLLGLTRKPVGWVSYHTGLSHDFIIINPLKLTSVENGERATFTTGNTGRLPQG